MYLRQFSAKKLGSLPPLAFLLGLFIRGTPSTSILWRAMLLSSFLTAYLPFN